MIDHQLNAFEGWDVFQTLGTEDVGDLRIERIDELEVFANDYEAWVFVAQRSIEGSERHTAALITVFKNNPTERQNILDYLDTLGILLPDRVRLAGVLC